MVISQQKMELFNENIIPTRTLREIVSLDNVVANQSIVNGSFNGGTITIGSKENVFKVDRNGIYLGASSFSVAPFRVDMQGDVVANSIIITGGSLDGTTTIGGRLCSTVAEAIDANGHFIDERFDTDSKTILSDFTFGTSGALQIGTYENGVSGDIRISSNGILGRNKDGDTTFSINGTTGDATFGGTLVAASGTFGTVTAGILSGVEISGSTITGGIVQTSTSGNRIVLDGSTNKLNFIGAAGIYASMIPYAAPQGYGFEITTSGEFSSSSSILMYEGISSNAISLYATNINLNGTTYTDNIIISSSISTPSLTLNGVQRTSWPSSFSGNLSDLYINTTKSWGSYGITGLGTITPYSNNSYSLGSSSYKWNNIYSTYGTFDYLGKSLNANSYGITGLGTITPYSNNSYDLGSSSYYWRNVYGINIIPHSSTDSYLGNSSYYWDYFYVHTIRGAGGINSIEIENNAFTRYLFPAYNVTYDIGGSGFFYKNVFTQSLRLRTGQSTNPANDGEINYYDVEGGGYRGRVRGYLMQFDGTLK